MDPVTIGAIAGGLIIAYLLGKRSKPATSDQRSSTSPVQTRHVPTAHRHFATEQGGLRPDPYAQLPDIISGDLLSKLKGNRVSEPISVVDTKSSEFELSEDQRAVVEYLASPPWDHQVLAVLGAAGTGKSTVLHSFCASNPKLNVVRVAPTGIAARNIGGSTIHSFFRLPPQVQPLDGSTVRIYGEGSERQLMMKRMDILVIDEISMARVDLIDAIDQVLRKNLRVDKPFGGKRVVMFGDPLQLEPVVGKSEGEYIADNWKSPFFFDARVFREIPFKAFTLSQVHRQVDDPGFARALHSLRDNSLSGLTSINERVQDLNGSASASLRLVTTNRGADTINQHALAQLPTNAHTFVARVIGTFDETTSNLPCDKEITVKVGAEVLIVVNGVGYVNGSRGLVTEVNTTGIKVFLETGTTVNLPMHSWEQIEYIYDKEANTIVPKSVGKFIQLPVKLGWAITIHKAQGMTLDSAHLDLGRGAFAHGQTYVGLSRVRRLEGLSLERQVQRSDILMNGRVLEFLTAIQRADLWKGTS